MSERAMLISKETEEKRLEEFKRLSENWDELPDDAAGKLDGIISTLAMFYLMPEKKCG